jgi:AcrR family transcriptional regulator
LSEVARRLGVRPPSLYKYFQSRLALFDRVFQLGHQQHLDAFRAGAEGAQPGLPLIAALQAGGRWAMANQPLAQLLFWRPVSGFEPSAEAYAPSVAMVQEVRHMLDEAVARGQLGPDAATDEGAAVLSVRFTGMLCHQLANAPHESFEDGRFTRLGPRIFAMYKATTRQRRSPMQTTLRPDWCHLLVARNPFYGVRVPTACPRSHVDSGGDIAG